MDDELRLWQFWEYATEEEILALDGFQISGEDFNELSKNSLIKDMCIESGSWKISLKTGKDIFCPMEK
jgi:hypothetical protein